VTAASIICSMQASDSRGGSCQKTITVCVPHDQGKSSCRSMPAVRLVELLQIGDE
jgi:hypothetical protein